MGITVGGNGLGCLVIQSGGFEITDRSRPRLFEGTKVLLQKTESSGAYIWDTVESNPVSGIGHDFQILA